MILKNKTVALPGLGGAGGQHIITLARMGVGGFHIADNDYYELKNFNRQYGATLNSINQHKVKVMTDSVLNINPDIRLKSWAAFIDKSNVEDFLSGCDLVIDCVDAFNIEARRLIFNNAKEMNIPVITAGPIGYSCALLTFLPNSISFDDYIDYHEEDSNDLNFLRFIFGLTPRPYHLKYLDTKSVNSFDKSGSSISTSIALCSGFAGVEALKVLLNKGVIKAAPHFHYYDPFLMKFKIGYNLFGNRNPTQKLLLKLAKKSKGLQFLQEGV